MNQLPPPNFSRSDLPEHKHQRVLVAAFQVGHPIVVDGKASHIYAFGGQQIGGHVEMVIYLPGDPTPIDASRVSLQKQPE
ncbi:hypothetical protein [Massilia pseudoviolaceinigra]|uniref:hypothetical protein n=1 Tax=Massilia pseudoviolaceinigra TaxID=3057165 RepID=UPI0027966FC8|nr:hypothetical protein [Massilia sp. CCM 9206]MDQ1921292.1 hypothetical protein [Massilia sp. CCM 9206]